MAMDEESKKTSFKATPNMQSSPSPNQATTDDGDSGATYAQAAAYEFVGHDL